MRKALESLPWVEKSSIQISLEDRMAVFKVTDPKEFDLEKVRKALPSQFKPSIAKTGSAIPTS